MYRCMWTSVDTLLAIRSAFLCIRMQAIDGIPARNIRLLGVIPSKNSGGTQWDPSIMTPLMESMI